jgi:hypothetical protein
MNVIVSVVNIKEMFKKKNNNNKIKKPTENCLFKLFNEDTSSRQEQEH